MSDSFDPLDSSPPGSSVYGIFQARILEWVAISFSREKEIIFFNLFIYLAVSGPSCDTWTLELKGSVVVAFRPSCSIAYGIFVP